jgi:hypothetical protein
VIPPAVAVGPSAVHAQVQRGTLALDLRVSPNRGAVANAFSVRARSGGRPLHGARLSVSIRMLGMPMPPVTLRLREGVPGTYATSAAPFLMLGRYDLTYTLATPRGRHVALLLVDRVTS